MKSAPSCTKEKKIYSVNSPLFSQIGRKWLNSLSYFESKGGQTTICNDEVRGKFRFFTSLQK